MKRSASYYASHPEAAAKKRKYQARYQKSGDRVAYRVELKRERRRRGIYGQGGPDMSHTTSGKMTPEDPSKNRARNGHGAAGRFKKDSAPRTVGQVRRDRESAAWQRKAGKNPEGGLNAKGIASYRKANPGSKLSLAVTTDPSKLKPGSKKANRRKSFCARMSGMKSKLTSAKTANDPDSRINKSLRKWNCN